MTWLTPARRRGREYLDDSGVAEALRLRSMRDVVRSNALLGGARALLREVAGALPLAESATLLDVGTGLGDLPERAARDAAKRGVRLTTICCDREPVLLRANRSASFRVAADALALPFGNRTFDIVTCSQLAHHFDRDGAVALVREMHRVARRAVIVADLRRSWFAMAGFWLVSFPLGFHAITRHDGTLSVLRGFTPAELGEIVARATGRPARVTHRAGFRLTAVVNLDEADG